MPMLSSLIASAAGTFENVDLEPRHRVGTELTFVTKAAHAFAPTEAFVQHTEDITGLEYMWKRYDLVDVPPLSFPYEGMATP